MKNKILVDVNEVIKRCIEEYESYEHRPSETFIDVMNDLYGIEQKVYDEISKQKNGGTI